MSRLNPPYDVLYIDCPWPFRVYSKDTGHGRSAESHYGTMEWEDMFNLPIRDLLTPNGVAFVWTTNSSTHEALDMMRWGWELEFVTKAFTWAKVTKSGKDHFGMGYTTRQNTETLWLFKKPGGQPYYPDRAVREYQEASIEWEIDSNIDMLNKVLVTEHSAKPGIFRDQIKKLMGPNKKFLEIFARTQNRVLDSTYEGWDFMGNEVDGQDIRVQLPELLRESGIWKPNQIERIRLNPTLTYGAIRSLQLGRATVVELPSDVKETKTALNKQLAVQRAPVNNPYLRLLASFIPKFEQSNWLKVFALQPTTEPSTGTLDNISTSIMMEE